MEFLEGPLTMLIAGFLFVMIFSLFTPSKKKKLERLIAKANANQASFEDLISIVSLKGLDDPDFILQYLNGIPYDINQPITRHKKEQWLNFFSFKGFAHFDKGEYDIALPYLKKASEYIEKRLKKSWIKEQKGLYAAVLLYYGAVLYVNNSPDALKYNSLAGKLDNSFANYDYSNMPVKNN